MNHQPFENWLLEDEPLTVQQERELQTHLRSCTSCSAIADSNLSLHSTRLISPRPGFGDRFRPRLAAWRRDQVRRQAIGTIILVLAGLGLLYALAWPAMWRAVQDPAAWFREITAYGVTVLTFVSVLGHVSSILLRDLPSVLPPGTWLVVLMALGILGALWVSIMRRLAKAPQGV